MLNDALKMLRVFSQQTQTELSQKLGISKSYLSELESGKKKPPLDIITKYSEVFDVQASQILRFSEQMKDDSAGEKVRVFSAKQILRFMQWIADEGNNAKTAHQ